VPTWAVQCQCPGSWALSCVSRGTLCVRRRARLVPALPCRYGQRLRAWESLLLRCAVFVLGFLAHSPLSCVSVNSFPPPPLSLPPPPPPPPPTPTPEAGTIARSEGSRVCVPCQLGESSVAGSGTCSACPGSCLDLAFDQGPSNWAQHVPVPAPHPSPPAKIMLMLSLSPLLKAVQPLLWLCSWSIQCCPRGELQRVRSGHLRSHQRLVTMPALWPGMDNQGSRRHLMLCLYGGRTHTHTHPFPPSHTRRCLVVNC
jgi:hypothetical protein